MKKLFQLFSVIFFLFILNTSLFAVVLNPVQGTWANKQVLVVDVPSFYSVYYSFDGQDPESSGIAYDGPVLLDLDGNVNVTVAVIDSEGNKKLERIEYTVDSSSVLQDEKAAEFVESFNSTGIIDYTAGSVISIPNSLEYSFGTKDYEFEEGCDLSLNKDSVVSRFVPCIVSDKKAKWRFIINVHSAVSGLFTRKDVPFKISDWETVTFTDRKKIYKIDDGWWYQPMEPLFLDRSQSHMIYWQDVSYSQENIVKYYVLDPKPSLKTENLSDGSVSVSFSGSENYKLGILDSEENASELFEQITIDTFKGDDFSGNFEVGVFSDSVYQGKLEVPFRINKKMPCQPVITPSVPGKFIRKNTKVTVTSPDNNDIYTSFLGPVVLNGEYSKDDISSLFVLSKEDFKVSDNTSFNLTCANEGASAYKITAYAMDKQGNKSRNSEYYVIIDTCNFYLNGNAISDEEVKNADGSKECPYSSFEDLIQPLNENPFVRVNVCGKVLLPNKKISTSSNCSIVGTGDARFVAGEKTSFDIKSSSFSVSNIVFSFDEENTKSDSPFLFNIERGVLFFSDVELNGRFSKNGTLINADGSVINIEKSGITLVSPLYACVVSSLNSKINVKKSRIAVVSDTAVGFSVQGGLFELKDSECSVTASLGRVAELFDTYSTVKGNTFTGKLKKQSGSGSAVFADKKNHTVEFAENKESGF